MAINVEALIRSLGKRYREMMDAGLIPYLTEPKGASGSPKLSLDMVREGIFLSFHRDGKIFKEMSLRIQNDEVKNWIFPNELPSPLQYKMSREWVHETFGPPDKSVSPKKVGTLSFGWFDRFTVEGFDFPLTMQMGYDLYDMVTEVTFLPTSELRW